MIINVKEVLGDKINVEEMCIRDRASAGPQDSEYIFDKFMEYAL